MTKYEKFFYKNIKLAQNMSKDVPNQFKHASIITNNRFHILSIGTNNGKTHTLTQKYNYNYPFVHSEVDAFSKLSYTDKQHYLYLFNYRFNKNGVLGISYPCKYCMAWVITTFDKIFFSDENGMKQLI